MTVVSSEHGSPGRGRGDAAAAAGARKDSLNMQDKNLKIEIPYIRNYYSVHTET